MFSSAEQQAVYLETRTRILLECGSSAVEEKRDLDISAGIISGTSPFPGSDGRGWLPE